MAQQTSVEWLEKQLLSHTKIENSKYIQQEIIDIAVWQFNKYLEQAKQIEKEQIIEAHGKKINGGFRSNGDFFQEEINGEQYYNETYNK